MPKKVATKKPSQKTPTTKNSASDNKKLLSILSVAVPILGIIILLLIKTPGTKIGYYSLDILAILVGIAGIILSRIGKSEKTKSLSTAGLVIGIIICIFFVIDALSTTMIGDLVKNCTKNADNTSTCEFMGQEYKLPTIFVTEERK